MTKSSDKIQSEKKGIQMKAHVGEAADEICGFCGRGIVAASAESDRWYHYSGVLRWLSMADMTRYCVTPIGRMFRSRQERNELRNRLPAKVKATPKAIVDEYYKGKSQIARERLLSIHDELAA